MQTANNPCLLFNFPMKIAMIDDDKDLLNIMSSMLLENEVSPYTSPENLFKNIDPININTNDFIHEDVHGAYGIDFKKIKEFVDLNSKKHGLIISDYRMLSINGIDLLHKYIDSDMAKVLLTGVFTSKDAVSAFNNKIIDYFLPKSQLSNLSTFVNDIQIKFFRKKSKKILKSINLDNLLTARKPRPMDVVIA